MKRLFYTLAYTLLIVAFASCAPEVESVKYPELNTLDNTLWYSYNQTTTTYYDVVFAANDGEMIGYEDAERTKEISREGFEYTFDNVLDVVAVNFDNGARYAGILVPKGEFQISNIDVYIIQLYGVDENGEILYTPEGQLESSLLFWME
ncbi:MAG: hypothetical protein IKW52_01555 [Alistipes sp.]|nr:hypothetical protein [Alistipes sp.]